MPRHLDGSVKERKKERDVIVKGVRSLRVITWKGGQGRARLLPRCSHRAIAFHPTDIKLMPDDLAVYYANLSHCIPVCYAEQTTNKKVTKRAGDCALAGLLDVIQF